MQSMNVGILGSGVVARALAPGFAGLGHQVKVGSRTPEKLAEWAAGQGGQISTGTFEETARFGDLLVLATLGTATLEVIELSGRQNFESKAVIDTTNPLDFSKGTPRLFVGHTDSLGEQIQRTVPKARVVKAFNTVGNAHMVQPRFPGGPPDMFICGDDAGAKTLVTELCHDFGWGVIDIGGIDGSQHLEPMCMVWVLHGVRTGGWDHAFKMLHK